ncbi:MAG: hypothetical protein JW941_09310, partial [Candidatus Coatesbacteria bacterium]|nr:hypothetical protein [Candidatus Coatesbacteria bacterium]
MNCDISARYWLFVVFFLVMVSVLILLPTPLTGIGGDRGSIDSMPIGVHLTSFAARATARAEKGASLTISGKSGEGTIQGAEGSRVISVEVRNGRMLIDGKPSPDGVVVRSNG